jgi:nitrite reductase/ring-hydroxylating ferredoxin subunit
VSACGGLASNDPYGGGVDNAGGAVGSASTRAPSGTRGGDGGSDSDGGGAGGVRLAKLSELPAGGGKVVNTTDGQKYLLVRSGNTVKAYDAACPHQGATVRAPSGGTVVCPLHGSQFSATDGSLRKGPAKTGLSETQVKVVNGEVVTV